MLDPAFCHGNASRVCQLSLWSLLLLFLLPRPLSPLVLRAAPASPSTTIINQDIVRDTTWTLAGSPYEVARFSRIQKSSGKGVETSTNSVVTIEASEIVANADYGIHNLSNHERDQVFAANNWWGTSNGPTVDGGCNPQGRGSRISAGVVFVPFLKASAEKPASLLPSAASIVTLSPQRWFTPADSVTRLYVTLSLHDGNGLPLPGRKLVLSSSLGQVFSDAVTDALVDAIAHGEAAAIALDRYGGAAAANDLLWSSQQAAALIYYKEKMAEAYMEAADRLDALRAVVHDEGTTSIPVTVSEIVAYQNRLATSGFTAGEIAQAKAIGLSDAEIEANRQEIMTANPTEYAGDVMVYLGDLASAFRTLGDAILNPLIPVFSITGGVTKAGADAASSAPDQLARIFDMTASIEVSNPFSTTVIVDLRVRPLNLPSDWTTTVAPATVTLAPGEELGVTVSVVPNSATLQGTIPRVAVEGYVGSELLGGVVIDTIVPRYHDFDGQQRLFLPIMKR